MIPYHRFCEKREIEMITTRRAKLEFSSYGVDSHRKTRKRKREEEKEARSFETADRSR